MLKIDIKETGELKRELAVEIEPEKVQSAMDQQFAELRRSVTLKGFRKGKVPMNVIKSQYTDEVRATVADKLVRETFPEVVQEKQLRVAAPPTVTELDYADGGSLLYKATVEVFPEVDTIDYDGLTIQTVEAEVSDEEVDQFIEQVRRQASELRVVDRPAQDGDVVVVDLKKLFDARNSIPQDSFTDSEVDLGNKMTVKEFQEAMTGMKVDDEKEVMVHYEKDYSDPKLAGAEIRYHCKVKAVKERILPAFNDGFAKSTGLAETALEMKLKVREDIRKHRQKNLDRAYRRELVTQLCGKNEIPVPEGLLNEYLDSVVGDIKKDSPEADEKDIRTQYRPVGINTLRWDILYHKLSEHERIEVLPSDTEAWIKSFAEANQWTTQEATEALRKSGRFDRLKESLLEEKVLDFLMGKASRVPLKK